jgi:hypothetical protein
MSGLNQRCGGPGLRSLSRAVPLGQLGAETLLARESRAPDLRSMQRESRAVIGLPFSAITSACRSGS